MPRPATDLPAIEPAYCARPRHRPEHAAPVFRSTSLSWQARRAVKLAGTALSWAAGLCLVVGAIAVVTRSPGRPVHVAAAAAARHAPKATSYLPPDGAGRTLHDAGPPVAARTRPSRRHRPAHHGARHRIVIAVFRGTGSQHTGQFSVSPARRWALRWSYSCSPGQQGDRFMVTEAGTAAADGATVDAHGANGSGKTWVHSGGSTHALTVTSTCSWIVKVVGVP